MRNLFIFVFLFSTKISFAQYGKDTIIYNLPIVNDKLIYKDSVAVPNKNQSILSEEAKKWFNDYYKYHETKPGQSSIDTLLGHGTIACTFKPGIINIPFYQAATIFIICKDGYYKYSIYNIYFWPQNKTLNTIGYENNPEELIKLYKQKHIGLVRSMTIDRNMIRKYISTMNTNIRASIVSLNKAMTSQ
jgi:hypothetical protein